MMTADVSVQEENVESESEGRIWGAAEGCYGSGLESLVFNIQPSGSYGIIKSW